MEPKTPEEKQTTPAPAPTERMTREELKERLQYFLRKKLPEWEAKQLAKGRPITA